MSDSDDTDILLLIPPDYFITTAQEKLQQEEKVLRRQRRLERQLDATKLRFKQYNQQAQFSTMNTADSLAMPPPPPPPPSAAYKYLPPNKKAELNLINARLQSIESVADREADYCPDRFAAPSDISTISACTVRSQMKANSQHQRNGLIHSTPKCRYTKKISDHNAADEGVLLEIDDFLDDRQNANTDWNHHSDEYRMYPLETVASSNDQQATSLPSTLNHLSIEQSPHVHFEPMTQQITLQPRDNNLISLSEIWSKSGQNTAIAAAGGTTMSLKEEQLRRQHLEKTVHSLQTCLLEYQQKISVAIEVDKQKDSALRSIQTECNILEEEVLKLRGTVGKLEHEQRESNAQKDILQRELAQAVSLATKFQEKNERLEAEITASARKSSECSNMYKAQLEELEIKMHGCKRSEEYALNELSTLKDKLAKLEYQGEKTKVRCEELEKENATLKHQKEILQEFNQKLKSRADGLEAQRKSLQNSLSQLTENEISLKKKSETQQKSLKMHYQQQLENVVAQKLKEFQEQLDKMEENLKTEARDRERLIADRAVKQLELINEKNELEHNLLQEKHNEEVELYRIQLANASKKIDDLELRLSCYKTKRADIAEKLHDVMETQWQKALEILTSPSNQLKFLDSNAETDTEISREHNVAGGRNDQATYETPKMSSKQHKTNTKQNNLNAVSSNNDAQKNSESEPVDRLQAYIELLLSKSPSDVDRLDEILALTKKTKTVNGKVDKTVKRNLSSHAKPPWKA